MADAATWAKRVAAWRASGLSSPAFCKGKDFTPGGLRYMAHRLEGPAAARRGSRVRIARVIRLPRVETARVATASAPAAARPAVVVELGAARVTVPPGADRETLATVFALLAPGVGR